MSEQVQFSPHLVKRPTDEEAMFVFSKDATKLDEIKFLEHMEAYLKQEDWLLTKYSTKYRGIDYAQRIIDGFIPSSSAVKKACERFLYELDRQKNDPSFTYYFDEEEAMRYINFVEFNFHIPNLKGGSSPFVYQPHQHFYLGQLVGWKDHRGNRRFKEALNLVGRGNGKTEEIHPLALYIMIQEGIISQTSMYLGGSKTQAKKLFNKAKTQVNNARPVVGELFVIRDEYIKVADVKSESAYYLATTNAMSSHGGNANFVIVDEVHTMSDDETLNTLIESMDKRYGSTVAYASTRSKGYSPILENKVTRGQYVLESYKTDATTENELYYLGYVEHQDELNNFWNWFKSNPNLMIQDVGSVITKYKMRKNEPEKVKEMKGEETMVDFLTQRFNFIDISSDKAYLPPNMVKKNHKTIDLSEIKGRDTFIGIDIGGMDDFTTITAITPYVETYTIKNETTGKNVKKTKDYIFVQGKSFITRSSYEDKRSKFKVYYPQIDDWVENGTLVVMDDAGANTTDLYKYLDELNQTYKLIKIGYDQYGIYGDISEYLTDRGYIDIAEKVNQRGSKYSNLVKDLQQKFKNGEVIYNRDPLLTYYFNNTHINEKANGLWTLGKGSSAKIPKKHNKIDGMASLVDAYVVMQSNGGFYKYKKKPTLSRGRYLSTYDMLKNVENSGRLLGGDG